MRRQIKINTAFVTNLRSRIESIITPLMIEFSERSKTKFDQIEPGERIDLAKAGVTQGVTLMILTKADLLTRKDYPHLDMAHGMTHLLVPVLQDIAALPSASPSRRLILMKQARRSLENFIGDEKFQKLQYFDNFKQLATELLTYVKELENQVAGPSKRK